MKQIILICLLGLFASALARHVYDVQVVSKSPTPLLSTLNPRGSGYTPCNYTFNPAFMPATPPGLPQSVVFVRVAQCPPEYGGIDDHIMYAFCDDNGVNVKCGDLEPILFPNFGHMAEDPRVFFVNNSWCMYYYADGVGVNTVYLQCSKTPLDPNSWTPQGPQALAWHRNGCVLLRPDNRHYVFYGESGPLPALGVAMTSDFSHYDFINTTWMVSNGPNDPLAPEVVIEAATPPVQLSTGDYLHIYAAGTPGWVPDGNYTGGFVILDRADPSLIIQKSATHIFMPTMDYEIGNGPYTWQRKRTMFVTSMIPIEGEVDTFRAWYGAADSVVATAVVKVTIVSSEK